MERTLVMLQQKGFELNDPMSSFAKIRLQLSATISFDSKSCCTICP